MAPGKINCIKVGKEFAQKRHLLNNVTETYELFKKDFPDARIGRSRFASLRPKNVLPFDDIPHNVCVFPLHENMKLIIDALSKMNINDIAIGRALVDACVCSRQSAICMKIQEFSCMKCKFTILTADKM